MSSLTFGAEFENRTGAIITAQADLAFQPLRWKAAANGGPVESEIRVTGTRSGLKSLRDWLRYPVAIYNPAGSICRVGIRLRGGPAVGRLVSHRHARQAAQPGSP